MSEPLIVTIDEHVASVTLNRPDKHNAVNVPMFEALAEAGSQLAGDPSIRAVVLSGAGPSFCAGIDLGIFQQGAAAFECWWGRKPSLEAMRKALEGARSR